MENELITHLAQTQSYLGWILIVLIIGFFLVVSVLWLVVVVLAEIKAEIKEIKNKE